jgi:signal transduction histidine kinase
MFMALKNNLSPAWQMNIVQLMLFLVLLVDWISFIFLIIIGFTLSYLAYSYTTHEAYFLGPDRGGFITFAVSAVIYAIFSKNRQKLEDERLSTMKSISASIAHELRTPLRTITSAAHGIKKYLPLLMDSYLLAKKANLPVQTLDPFHYESLVTACDDIDSEAQASFTVINMLLMNVSQLEAIGKKSFKKCSIHQCLDEALRRYPFDSDEAKLVHWQEEQDFDFKGDETLIIHVIFNLMKNALYQIKAAGKGDINIWVELRDYNELHFKDTAKGISAKNLHHIFDMFYSDTYHGAGIGLAFCKVVMQSLNGKIEALSKEGEYAEFILYFPRYVEN